VSRAYRTVPLHELPALARGGTAAKGRLKVPARLILARSDPVVTAASLDGCEPHAEDLDVESIDGGHFLPEKRCAAAADRIRVMPGA
jgi:surfactin synthase thioesterase subunit